MRQLKRYIFAAVGLIGMMVPAMGQDYYDDIYGGPRKQSAQQKRQSASRTADYAPADSYAPDGSLQMDVDEYNRRGQFLVSDSVSSDSVGPGDTFAYTRRIERFHNPDIVTESGDTTLCDYYYSTPQSANINVYVVDNSPYYPYSWAWRYGSPWYWNVYGPAYVGWGGWYGGWYDPFWYDPYPWGWSWGWTWAPGWGPGWGPAWGPAWGPSVAWRPSTPGASRPHRPVGNGVNSGRGQGGNYYAGNGGYNSSRPGNMGRPTGSANKFSGSTLRPGYSGNGMNSAATARPGTRPNPSQGTYTPYGAGTRGGSNTRGYSGSTRQNNYDSGSNRQSAPSRNSYNNTPSRNSSSGSRSGYSSGGSRGGFGSGSHSTRGGGGSGRSGGGRGRR